MQRVIISLSFLMISLHAFSQQDKIQITDISSDGKLISVYEIDNSTSYGTVEKLTDDIPFGLTPDWTSVLNRQIGGMAWGDYDDDGDLDLATGCYFSQSFPPIPEYEVLIYKNENGILTSTPAWISSDMRSTTDVKFADLNGDNKPELLAANGDQSFVPSVIYFNGANGLNNVPGWISQDNSWTVGAAFCDIDNDGDLDLAFGNQGNSVTPAKPICIFYNNAGTFSSVPNWLSADQMITNSVAFGDIDNQQLISKMVEFTGDGIRYAFPLPLYPIYSIDSVFVDDLLYYQYCYNPISGWISLGVKPPSGFTVRVIYKYVSSGDLAASKWVNYESGIYFNNNGVINNLPGWTIGNTQSQKGIAWSDFNRDGFLDLAISGSGVQTVIYRNINGVLTGPVWTSNSVNPSAQELITGDLDRDGYPELAVVHFGSKRVEIFKNRNGILDTDPTWLYIAGSSATSVSFGDLNGDGALDLAVGTARLPVVVFLNQSPVPVELKSFSAVCENKQIKLSWSTSAELNNRGFSIERKVISEDFISIGFVEGHGTTTEQQNYSFTDKNLNNGKYFYRLKQFDYNGSYEYSYVIEVELKSFNSYLLEQNYPNPFNPSTVIEFSIPENAKNVKLTIYNALGERVAKLVNGSFEPGIYEYQWNAVNFASGLYIYELRTEKFVAIKKMMLVK